MDIYKKHNHKGIWWRSDFADEKIPGALEIIQNRSITLRTDILLPTKDGVHHFPSTIGTILGNTLKGEPVTLINCGYVFGDVYGSPLAIIGKHFKDCDDINFNSIKVFYTLLTEWAYKEEYINENGTSFEIKDLGISIIFNFEPKKSVGKRKKNIEEIISSVTINSENSKDLQEWWDIIILLRNFIILGLNVPVYPYSFLGIKKNKKEVKIYRTTNTNFGHYLEKLRHEGYLFRLRDIKDNLNLYLGNLFKKSENLNRVMTNYYSILNNPEIYNADKFLNLTSILEGYHRCNMKNEEMEKEVFSKFKKDIIKKSKKCLCDGQIKFINNKIYDFGYEKSLNKRLKELLDKCKSFIPLEKSEGRNYIQKISKTRNIIAHGLKEKEEIPKGENLYKALSALEFLFVTNVLKEIGFDDNLLSRLLSGFNKFNWPYNDITRLFKI